MAWVGESVSHEKFFFQHQPREVMGQRGGTKHEHRTKDAKSQGIRGVGTQDERNAAVEERERALPLVDDDTVSDARRTGESFGVGVRLDFTRSGDPSVVRIANTWFTYLKDSDAKIEVALGDARLNLEREPSQQFDVLAIDAFSGDSIPTHLITYEAVGVYLRHMKPEGVMAFHVSNRFLDLKPVLLAIAEKRGLEYAYVHETGEEGGTTSDWVLITRDKPFILRPSIVEATEPVLPRPEWNLWTDDFNNLVQVFRY